jgi:hypothetical protein
VLHEAFPDAAYSIVDVDEHADPDRAAEQIAGAVI